ncbi:MAG: copper amine oxidase N-terminal domain-containing protein [Marinisporobacter sp.]|nr:copper amine oxidase N-terminal domain-containing protein [Marinisporobacter sp.]
MLKKRKMKVVTLVFILIISLILPTIMGYAVESETIEITQDTATLKQIQSSILNVTVKNDGSYGAVLRNPENPSQPRSIFYSIYNIGKTRSGTIQLKGDYEASFESLPLKDFSMEGKIIKVTKEKSGIARYTLRTSIVNATPEGSDMKLEMTMENLKATPQNMGLYLHWDTKVNGQDSSPFIGIENGWVNFYDGILVTAFFKDTPHVTNADAISFGPGRIRPRMTWEEHANVIGQKTSNGDGYANAWYDPIAVGAGESRTVSFIIGGANDQGAIISEDNMSSIASKNYSPGESISLTGKVEDPDAIGNIVDVMCSLGNNNPVKLGTLDTASGAKTYDYNYTLPSDLAPGLYPLKLWVRDHLFAESNVVSANINIPANQNPSISINNPSEDHYYNSGKITISGNASDADDDDMIISASIDGNTVTDIVYGGDGNWTLEWDIDALDISDATYTDILVSADDGNSGTGTDTYIGDLILDTIKPSGNISTDISSYTKGKVKLTLTVSDDGSGIRKVKRPDNQWVVRLLSGESQSDVVSGAVYEAVYSPIDQVEYTVSQNGEYAFFVEDFVGNQNKIALNISNIDKSIPTADFTLSTDDWTNETVTIHVYGVDNGQSGIKRIKRPNNTWVSGHEASYNVSENGTYNFVIENNVGNQNTISTSVTNIDKSTPTAKFTLSTENWTNEEITIHVDGVDNGQSGIKRIKLPNNTWVSGHEASYNVSENGTYNFVVENNVGNQNTISTSVTNIDKSIPTAKFTLSTENWTNEEVTIHVNGVDNGQSGIKRIKLPNNTWVSGDKASYNVSENGTYKFVVENNAGNQNMVSTSVTNIGKSTPAAKFTLSTENWTNEEVTIHVNGVDNGQSGIKRIKLPNNTWVSGDKASYNVSENGTYKFVVENNAGNQNTVSTSIKNIDKVAPSKPVIERAPDVNDYRGVYVIKITDGEDKSSGVKETQYRLSGATEKTWTKYENPIEITVIGKTTIEAKTIDQVGNESQIVTIDVNVIKKSSSSDGGSSSSLKDVDGDIEVDKTSKNPAPTINLSEDRDGKAPVSLKTVKEMKEANKTILVKNNGVKIGFKPNSIEATVIKEELEKELDKKLDYENVEVILGAEEVSSSEKEQIIRKANLGKSTGLFQVGGKVFDLTAKVVKEKNGTKTEEKINHFNEPVEVTVDLKGSNLTQKDIEKLTAVRYERDEKGNVKPIKLGGKYDSKAKTFTFYTDTFSLYSIVKADDMLEIDLKIGKTGATVNKEIKENDVAPKIINNRTMVPVRFIAENMGAHVAWDKEIRKVTIELDGQTMSMIIDEEIEEFNVAPMIIDGRTLVPIRYVSEKLGAYVIWFPTDKKVRIVK